MSVNRQSCVEIDAAGTVHVPAYDVPLAVYMSEEAQRSYTIQRLTSPIVDWPIDVLEQREAALSDDTAKLADFPIEESDAGLRKVGESGSGGRI